MFICLNRELLLIYQYSQEGSIIDLVKINNIQKQDQQVQKVATAIN
jgi:hypothetical protein